MATYGGTLRRGLPRTPGGEPWPAVGETADAAAPAVVQAAVPEPAALEAVAVAPVSETGVGQDVPSPAPAASRGDGVAVASAEGPALRRGLPRTPGGEPWPAAGAPTGAAASSGTTASTDAPVSLAPEAVAAAPASGAPGVQGVSSPASQGDQVAATSTEGPALRRGLPRTPGGESWPPGGALARIVTPAASAVADAQTQAAVADTAAAAATPAPTSAPAASTALVSGPHEPLPFTPGVIPGKYAFTRPPVKPEPKRIGPFTRLQWGAAAAILGLGLLYAAAMAVLAVRWFLSTDAGVAFLTAFPGEYHLPAGAPVGLPAWLGWQHFFNFFLMFLIIRSGWRVRRDQRPSAFWTGRGKQSKKISLNLWFHQSLDLLWVINGVVFLVLLFVTGQWMRIVPTSWEVFPNALSAVLQYASLDWPTENGWVNYNSVQQLAYFTTVFIAAPLAVITGIRMGGLWPSKSAFLNRVYPVEWARAVHFPVMLYFVAFILVHVFLVFATGALRNLNHMFAAQGSVDPGVYADNWFGFWMFAASMAVVVGAWVAARPMVLAPIAKLFGTVSAR